MSNEQVETPAEFCEWLVSMNALSNVGSRRLVTLSNIIERADLALRAATPTPQVVDSTCTCPSGDGSLRWPCPQHPPTPDVDVLAEVRAAMSTFRTEMEEHHYQYAGSGGGPAFDVSSEAVEIAQAHGIRMNAILDGEPTQ